MKSNFSYGFVDMHCHVLPAVDDGSKNMEMSLNMLRIAYENNIRTIIATPHNKIYVKSVSPKGIHKRVAILQEEVDKAGIDIKIYPGNELYYDETLPGRLEEGNALPMGVSSNILVEFNPSDEYSYISEGLRRLSYEGWSPILAHCERYQCFYKDKSRIDEIIDGGVRLQINSDSVTMGMLNPVGRFVRKLLSQHKISFVSTDAHRDTGSRVPDILECAKFIQKKYGEDYARLILYGNAMNLLR